MKKSIILIGSLVFGYNLKYAISDYHAFTLSKNKTNILLEYQLLNDTVDIFNLKQQELKGISSKYGSIGDYKGFKFEIRHGINDKLTLIAYLNNQKVQYSSDNWLNNKKLKFLARYNFYQNEINSNALSLDIGIETDKANTLAYSNFNLLETLASKILNKNIIIGTLNNPTYPYYIQYNTQKKALKERPTIYSDLSDKSYFATLNLEKKFQKSFLDFFITLKQTYIKTNIYANKELQETALQEGYNLNQNLDRNEKALNLGFNISYSPNQYVFEFTYYYARFFRNKDLNYIDYNHIINMTLAKSINNKILVYISGKIMYRQFNGEIPYLYNKYSQTTFDHKYGYATFGIGYFF